MNCKCISAIVASYLLQQFSAKIQIQETYYYLALFFYTSCISRVFRYSRLHIYFHFLQFREEFLMSSPPGLFFSLNATSLPFSPELVSCVSKIVELRGNLIKMTSTAATVLICVCSTSSHLK